MRNYKLILTILFTFQLLYVAAQKPNKGFSKKTYVLRGSIDVAECDSIKIIIYKRPAFIFGKYSQSQKIVKVTNREFEFKDQSEKDVFFYVSVWPYVKNSRLYNPLKIDDPFNGVYLAKSDDSVYVHMASDGIVHFYGNGANKYNLQYMVNSIPQYLTGFSVSDTTSLVYFRQLENQVDSLQRERIDLIARMKGLLTKTEYDLIYLNCYFGFKAARLDTWKKTTRAFKKISYNI
jgi:hypothetical protein